MTFGEKIQRLRIDAGLTQTQLASELSVSRLDVSFWELDEDAPSMAQLSRLSRLFGVPMDYLVSENNKIYPNMPIYDDAMEMIREFDADSRKTRIRKAMKVMGTLFFVIGLLSVFALQILSSIYPAVYVLSNPAPAGGGLPYDVTYTGSRAFLLEHDLVITFAIICIAGIAGVIMSLRKVFIFLVAVAVSAVSVLLYLEEPYIQYVHPTVYSLDYLYEPIQIWTTGGTTLMIGKTEVSIEYVAVYVISGRVLGYKDYSRNNMAERLMPRDVAIAWGWLTDTELDSKFQWGPFGHRNFSYRPIDYTWYNRIDPDTVISSISNNHLIPDSDRTRQLIRDIRDGDFITIEGYLVNLIYPSGRNSYITWESDTARNNHDCEVILVTDITWLQKPG